MTVVRSRSLRIDWILCVALLLIGIATPPPLMAQWSDSNDPQIFEGQVVHDATGHELAHVPVRLYWSPPQMCGTGWMIGARIQDTRADAKGCFRFEVPDRVALWAVASLPSSHSTFAMVSRLSGPPELRPLDPRQLEIRARDGGRVAGVVRDHRGHLAGDTEVHAFYSGLVSDPIASTRTDPAGHFVFEHLPASFALSTSIGTSTNHEMLRGKVEAGGSRDDIELGITLHRDLSGRVSNADGSPAAGVLLSIRHDENERGRTDLTRTARFNTATYTDARGVFLLVDVPRYPLELTIEDRLHLPWSRVIDAGTDEVDVILDGGTAAFGVVRDSRGAPLSGASVHAARLAPQITDGSGRFRLIGLPRDEPVTLVITATDHATQLEFLESPREDAVELDVLLEPERILSGQVLDANGVPVSRRYVSVRSDRPAGWSAPNHVSWEKLAGIVEPRTDSEGRFTIGSLGGGTYRVGVSVPTSRGAYTVSTHAGRDDLVIRLPDPSEPAELVLSGRVLSSTTGDPIPSCRIQPKHNSGGSDSYAVDVDPATGRFETAVLPTRMEYVDVVAPGHAGAHIVLGDGDSGHVELDIRLEPEVPVRVRVVDEDGRPRPDARLWARAAHGRVLYLIDGTGTYGLHTYSGPVDEHGEAVLRRLPRGKVALDVSMRWADPDRFGVEQHSFMLDTTAITEDVLELVAPRP